MLTPHSLSYGPRLTAAWQSRCVGSHRWRDIHQAPPLAANLCVAVGRTGSSFAHRHAVGGPPVDNCPAAGRPLSVLPPCLPSRFLASNPCKKPRCDGHNLHRLAHKPVFRKNNLASRARTQDTARALKTAVSACYWSHVENMILGGRANASGSCKRKRAKKLGRLRK
jgi:hypothetical protein